MAIVSDFQARLIDISKWLSGVFAKDADISSVVEAHVALVSKHQLANQQFAASKTALSGVEQEYKLREDKKKLEKQMLQKKASKMKK